MKAIIPLAGIGSRLKPHTRTQPKSLIPLAGKPILGHIMDRLVEAGVTDFVFVIGYLGDRIEQYITENYGGYKSTFVIQTLGRGIGHAVWLAREEFASGERMMIVLGDTIFEADFKSVLAQGGNALGVKKVEDPRLFGVAELDEAGSADIAVGIRDHVGKNRGCEASVFHHSGNERGCGRTRIKS